jgi:hypothetical protein
MTPFFGVSCSRFSFAWLIHLLPTKRAFLVVTPYQLHISVLALCFCKFLSEELGSHVTTALISCWANTALRRCVNPSERMQVSVSALRVSLFIGLFNDHLLIA